MEKLEAAAPALEEAEKALQVFLILRFQVFLWQIVI